MEPEFVEDKLIDAKKDSYRPTEYKKVCCPENEICRSFNRLDLENIRQGLPRHKIAA